MLKSNIEIFANKDSLAKQVAARFVEQANAAIDQRGSFSVALSGGSTPRALHEHLARAPYKDQIDWSKVKVFFGDERFLPPTDPESNFFMAKETLLSRVGILPENIYPLPTVNITAEAAALSYSGTLLEVLGSVPRLDLLLLGMGPDGHTASLFPGHPEVRKPGDAWVIAVHDSPKPPATRLSFSYKTINQARNVLILLAGYTKAEMLAKVFGAEMKPEEIPIQGVKPLSGNVFWMLDKEAARDL